MVDTIGVGWGWGGVGGGGLGAGEQAVLRPQVLIECAEIPSETDWAGYPASCYHSFSTSKLRDDRFGSYSL